MWVDGTDFRIAENGRKFLVTSLKNLVWGMRLESLFSTVTSYGSMDHTNVDCGQTSRFFETVYVLIWIIMNGSRLMTVTLAKHLTKLSAPNLLQTECLLKQCSQEQGIVKRRLTQDSKIGKVYDKYSVTKFTHIEKFLWQLPWSHKWLLIEVINCFRFNTKISLNNIVKQVFVFILKGFNHNFSWFFF